MKKKEIEVIETAIDMAEKLFNTAIDNGLSIEDFGNYVREWYINSRNTLPYMLRLSVLATFTFTTLIEGEYTKPLPKTVYGIIPDIKHRLKHRLPMYIIYQDRVEYEGLVYGFEWEEKIF